MHLAACALVALVVDRRGGRGVLSRRFDLPAPIVLVAVGVVGVVPAVRAGRPAHREVVLFGLLPPLLYAAALQTSLVDFNANRRAILLLSVGLVVFTTVGVAVVAYTRCSRTSAGRRRSRSAPSSRRPTRSRRRRSPAASGCRAAS